MTWMNGVAVTRLLRIWRSVAVGTALMILGPVALCQESGSPIEATVADDSMLSLDRLFKTGEFQSEPVPEIKWSRRHSYYFRFEPNADGPGNHLMKIDPETNEKEIFVPASAFVPTNSNQPLSIDSFEFSHDESRLLLFTNSQRVWRRNTRGDYWVLDRTTGSLIKLGGDAKPSTLMFAKFSSGGARVAYVRENNIYVQDLQTSNIVAVTRDSSASIINGIGDWVNEEELDLRDCFRWSPDGARILFWQFDTSGVSNFHLIDNAAGNTPAITTFAYPKVGTTNSAVRLGVVSASGGDVVWLNLPGDPREHYLPHAEWTPEGGRILVQQFNRLQNELKVFWVDPKNGAARLILTEQDDAWIENDNPFRWLDGGRSFLWLSERSGWRHAYRAFIDGSPLVPITQGSFDVIDVEAIDKEQGWLYYAASLSSATQRHVYRVRFDGSQTELVSPANSAGWHQYAISPDAKWGVHTHSTFTSPPVVRLVRLSDGAVVRTLVDNQQLREKLSRLRQPQIEFFQVDIGDGVELDGWSLKPSDIAPDTKLPLLMYVYGEPHAQTVRDAWPGTQGLWHWMLAQQGFVVASVDNRGTIIPKGRAWRKVVHRQIGILAPREQAAAVRVLLNRWPFVDPQRVGSWGWSGGGSMSLNAVFQFPDLYSTAIAVAPMADQQLYDTIYQERYMGLPSENPEGYRDGSPVTHAHRLQGNLLIIHGTADDNCHYQATERLMDRLIAHGKYFLAIPYPNRSHSIHEGENTSMHLRESMTRFLKDHLHGAVACGRSEATHAKPTADGAGQGSGDKEEVDAQSAGRVNRPARPRFQIINGSASTIDLFWLKSETERIPNGSVDPGQSKVITSTIGHQFIIVNREDSSETLVTCELPIQAFRYGGLPSFYTQQFEAQGFPIVASARVNPYALKEAAYIIDKMLAKRPDVREAMIKSGSRLCILAYDEYTTDQPEWAWMAEAPEKGFERLSGKDFWDARARGMGGSETDPYCSCGEENLLGYPGDPYEQENILIHELAHNIHLRGMMNVDPTFDRRLQATYRSAMEAGLWRGKYASVNHHEYFAEGVQSWFDDNRENDHDHNHVNTRAELIEYDPQLAELCREVFGDTEFRYSKPASRLNGHMAGYDPSQAPRFEFPARLREAKRLIRESAQKRDREARASAEVSKE